VSWSRRFEEPILLPDGRKLRTLREAINWLAKEVLKSEHKNGEGADGRSLRHARSRAQRADDLGPDGDDAGNPSSSKAGIQSRSQRPALGTPEAEAGPMKS
jgi:hypothetical protein